MSLTALHEALSWLRRGAGHASRHGWRAAGDRLVSALVDRRFPPAGSYETWLAARRPEVVSSSRLAVSVLVPVKDPAPAWLDALARSVLAQAHRDTELVLADDGCRDPAVVTALLRLAADPRVSLVRVGDGESAGASSAAVRANSSGISAATNAAAAAARGEVLIFADHDDELASGVLGEVAAAFEDDPDLELVFTDEDMLDAKGRRVAPSFRPGPSPWLALGFNCACHLLAVRRGLFERLGGLRSTFDGAQDHDLLLRAIEQARGVRHLAVVGYHWRRAPGSVSAGSGAKPWAYEAGRRAVVEACRRRGLVVAAVEHDSTPGVYRVEPEPVDERSPVRLLLHGEPAARARWRRAVACWAGDWIVSEERWPTSDGLVSSAPDGRDAHDAPPVGGLVGVTSASTPPGDASPGAAGSPLLVVAAATRPDPVPLRRLLAWLAQPGLRAVAGTTHDGRRRTNLGFTVDRDGVARALGARTHRRAVGPGLLWTAPREVAAGGEQLLALDAGLALPVAPGSPVRAEDLLLCGLAAAAAGAPLLLDPRASLALHGAVGPQPRAVDLRGTSGRRAVWAALPRAFFGIDGRDPWCPRASLLETLGVPPAPLASGAGADGQASSPSHTTV